MTVATLPSTSPQAVDDLIRALTKDALKIGDVTLSSGRRAKYLVDVKQVVNRPPGSRLVGQLVYECAKHWNAELVGGLTMGADWIAHSTISYADYVKGEAFQAFAVRKDAKEHGLQKLIEGVELVDGARCLIVDDVVTTGSSTVKAIEAVRDLAGVEIVGVVAVLDRLAGGGQKIEEASGAPYFALTDIDQVYPDRPDRG